MIKKITYSKLFYITFDIQRLSRAENCQVFRELCNEKKKNFFFLWGKKREKERDVQITGSCKTPQGCKKDEQFHLSSRRCPAEDVKRFKDERDRRNSWLNEAVLYAGSPWRDKISLAILELQEKGVIQILYDKWWKNTGDVCNRDEKSKESKANALGVENIGELSIFLLWSMRRIILSVASVNLLLDWNMMGILSRIDKDWVKNWNFYLMMEKICDLFSLS